MTPEDLARMADAELGPLPQNYRGPAPRIVASTRVVSSARVTSGGGPLAVPGFFRKALRGLFGIVRRREPTVLTDGYRPTPKAPPKPPEPEPLVSWGRRHEKRGRNGGVDT